MIYCKKICNSGILQVRLPTPFCALIVLFPYISHLQLPIRMLNQYQDYRDKDKNRIQES